MWLIGICRSGPLRDAQYWPYFFHYHRPSPQSVPVSLSPLFVDGYMAVYFGSTWVGIRAAPLLSSLAPWHLRRRLLPGASLCGSVRTLRRSVELLLPDVVCPRNGRHHLFGAACILGWSRPRPLAIRPSRWSSGAVWELSFSFMSLEPKPRFAIHSTACWL